MKRAWIPCLAVAVLLAAPEARAKNASRDAGPDFEWSWKIPAGKSIEIKGVNGEIQAERASGGEVEVFATKHARRSDPSEVRIEVNRHEDGVTICAVYPGAGNDCEPGSHWHSHTRDNDVVVDFHVRVPEGVRFLGQTVNGGIEAENLEGPVEARTVNGSVRISTTRTAIGTTVNGSVSATVGSAHWDEELSFGTVNGAVTVSFPRGLDADVDVTTVNGYIMSDFPVTVRGKIGRRHLSGKIGRGAGGELNLKTVNGNIRLLAAEE